MIELEGGNYYKKEGSKVKKGVEFINSMLIESTFKFGKVAIVKICVRGK